jgi:hypothetical protein
VKRIWPKEIPTIIVMSVAAIAIFLVLLGLIFDSEETTSWMAMAVQEATLRDVLILVLIHGFLSSR